jgi:uncharacterized RDD family membrane protein YckC
VTVFGTTYRLIAAPARVLANGDDVQRTVDELFAGPLPEMIGRSLREHAVVERVAAAAYGDRREQEARLRALLQTPEVERLLADVLRGPAVRAALVQQSTSFGAEAAAGVRRAARRLDAAVERAPRRWLGREPRVAIESARYPGLVTRALAYVVDAGAIVLALVVASALADLVSSLVGPLRPGWLVGLLVGSAWLLAQVLYFAGFWTAVGQTPGMRLMRVRLSHGGHPPGLGRSLLRLAALVVSIIPCFAGFLPALVDNRRRALPDFVAGTVVVSE